MTLLSKASIFFFWVLGIQLRHDKQVFYHWAVSLAPLQNFIPICIWVWDFFFIVVFKTWLLCVTEPWDLKTGCVINQQGMENYQQDMRLFASWYPCYSEWCQCLIQTFQAGTVWPSCYVYWLLMFPNPVLLKVDYPQPPVRRSCSIHESRLT